MGRIGLGQADADEPVTAAIILAAGASVRFGGFPKACLAIDGQPAVRRMVGLASDVGCEPVVVVVGVHEPEIRRALSSTGAQVVVNSDWTRGRTGSIQAGLQALPDRTDVLLWPVDHPFVQANSLRALLDARDRDVLALWFIPMHMGQSGHPVLLRHEAREFVLDLDPAAPLRNVLARLGPQVRRVPVPDPGVAQNIDTPEEFRRAQDAWRGAWTGG